MDHPIAKRGGRNNAVFGIENLDLAVYTGVVGAGTKVPLQSQDLGFQVGRKRGHTALAALAPRGP